MDKNRNERLNNSGELNDFVHAHNLMNRKSVVNFTAIVSIVTAKNKIENKEIEILISFDNFDSYGQVTFLSGNLDPNLFPTVFDGKWQNMKHVDNVYLKISDTHTKNSNIGKYEVKIVPIRKLQD